MGLRGPGAKPKGAKRAEPSAAPSGPTPWKKRGLSRADRVIRFIETLKLRAGKGAGKPFKIRPWQKDIIRRIYATDRKGGRICREALLTLARKNGKTQLAAALCLCHLCGPEAVQGGECYSAASDRNQAGRIFRELEYFVLSDADLSSRINIKRFEKTLEVLDGEGMGSIYAALSSDATKAHSLSPSFTICDELAQWRGREMFQNLRTGTGAFDEPLFVVISTMSPDPHSVMSEVVDYGRKVLGGVIVDPTFVAVIYEAPEDADIGDEAVWPLANPALGDFLSLEAVRKDAREAQRIPARENAFRNLRLNMAVEADERWIAAADWDACRGEIDLDALVGEACFGGLDLANVSDLTSFSLFWPGSGALASWSWCPADRVSERAEQDRVPYDVWSRDGLIELTPGRATDKRKVALRLAAFNALYRPKWIGFDRWGMPELLRILDEEGIELPLHEIGQGYAGMSPAMKAFEERALDRRLRHDGNPVLRWAMSNVLLSRDPAGNIKPDKSKSREKIDPVVASILAVGMAIQEPPERQDQVFRGDAIEAALCA